MANKKLFEQFCFVLILTLLATNVSFSQTNLEGKVFSTLYSTSCKEFADGGCIIQTYCRLTFNKNTVTVSFSSEADCTSEKNEKLYEKNSEKVYQWYMTKKVVHFRYFNDFGSLTLTSDGNLIGKKFSSDKVNNIEFIEEQ